MNEDNIDRSSLESDAALELTSLRPHDLLKIELNNRSETNFLDSFNFTGRKIEMTPLQLFLSHLKLLLIKNYTVQKRTRKQTYLQLFSPLLISFLIFALQFKIDRIAHLTLIDQPKHLLEPIPKCIYTDDNPNDCLTIAYSVIVKINYMNQSIMYFREIKSHGWIM